MASNVSRRSILAGAGAALTTAAVAGAQAPAAGRKVKIIAVACSPRKGKTTVTALKAALDAAKEAYPSIETELIDLGGLRIPAQVAAGVELEPGEKDDFPSIQEKLADPDVRGIIIGTPSYFGAMSSLCKAFIERLMVYRKTWSLRDKVAGAVVVGGAKYGGHELVVMQILGCLLTQDMILVGEGRPGAHRGGTIQTAKDELAQDPDGLNSVKGIGRRVAEVAMKLAASA